MFTATIKTRNGTGPVVAGEALPHTGEAALGLVVAELRRRFGPGAIMRLGETPAAPTAVISTGWPQLDQALGVGGLPCGRIIDIFGPESSGKTTLCLHVIAAAQQQGGVCVFIDAEHAVDLAYARQCGVDLARLYLAQPATGEEALAVAEEMVRGRAAVVVIDSAASLLPRAELEGEMGDNHAGLQARLMSQALRKLAGPVRQYGTVLIFTNQLRQNPQALFGSSTEPTGGMALRFHASVQIELHRLRAIKSSGDVVGWRIRAMVKKNKVAPPFRSAEIDIYHR